MNRTRNRSSYSTPATVPLALATRDCCGACGISIGSCSCNGGAGYSPGAMSPAREKWAAEQSAARPAGADQWGRMLRMTDGCYPRDWHGAATPTFASVLRGELYQRCGGVEPWSDPTWDWNHMDTVYVTQSVGALSTASIDVQPVQGTFTMFYYTLIARDRFTGALQDAWTYRQPAVRNCPVQCAQNDVDIPSQFASRMPEGCCGIPKIAFLAKPSDDSPLEIRVTNAQSAGALEFTVEIRGYCCSSKVC